MKNFEPEDERVEAALKHFRESVHAWSEAEFGRARTVQQSRWSRMWMAVSSPGMGWALAAALVVGGVAAPVEVIHQRHVAAEQAAQARARQEQERLNAEEAQKQAALAMSDDELLSHVDSDIAQATPDAMEPLASLMSDSSAR